MGIERPVVGFLTDAMLLQPNEVPERLSGWVQPRIEPEIAFVTARTIDHPLQPDEVAASIATVTVGAEILDSRFRLPDVVADNTSAAGIVLADRALPLGELGDLASLGCQVAVDGEIVHLAAGAAILGHPLRAVTLLADDLARRGESLPAGSVVLAGALTDAVPLAAGRHYSLRFGTLGTLDVKP